MVTCIVRHAQPIVVCFVCHSKRVVLCVNRLPVKVLQLNSQFVVGLTCESVDLVQPEPELAAQVTEALFVVGPVSVEIDGAVESFLKDSPPPPSVVWSQKTSKAWLSSEPILKMPLTVKPDLKSFAQLSDTVEKISNHQNPRTLHRLDPFERLRSFWCQICGVLRSLMLGERKWKKKPVGEIWHKQRNWNVIARQYYISRYNGNVIQEHFFIQNTLGTVSCETSLAFTHGRAVSILASGVWRAVVLHLEIISDHSYSKGELIQSMVIL